MGPEKLPRVGRTPADPPAFQALHRGLSGQHSSVGMLPLVFLWLGLFSRQLPCFLFIPCLVSSWKHIRPEKKEAEKPSSIFHFSSPPQPLPLSQSKPVPSSVKGGSWHLGTPRAFCRALYICRAQVEKVCSFHIAPPFGYLGWVVASRNQKDPMISADLVFFTQKPCCLPVHFQISCSLALSLFAPPLPPLTRLLGCLVY